MENAFLFRARTSCRRSVIYLRFPPICQIGLTQSTGIANSPIYPPRDQYKETNRHRIRGSGTIRARGTQVYGWSQFSFGAPLKVPQCPLRPVLDRPERAGIVTQSQQLAQFMHRDGVPFLRSQLISGISIPTIPELWIPRAIGLPCLRTPAAPFVKSAVPSIQIDRTCAR